MQTKDAYAASGRSGNARRFVYSHNAESLARANGIPDALPTEASPRGACEARAGRSHTNELGSYSSHGCRACGRQSTDRRRRWA
jgi:hypothetical protein